MSEFKRRKFLQTTGAVAASAAVGPFIWVKDANAQWSNAPEKGAKLQDGWVKARRPSSRPAMVWARSAPPVAGPATMSVCSSSCAGRTSSRSCARRQIVDGYRNS